MHKLAVLLDISRMNDLLEPGSAVRRTMSWQIAAISRAVTPLADMVSKSLVLPLLEMEKCIRRFGEELVGTLSSSKTSKISSDYEITIEVGVKSTRCG